MNKTLKAWLIGWGIYFGIRIGVHVFVNVHNALVPFMNAIKDKYEEYQCKKLFREVYGEIDRRSAA